MSLDTKLLFRLRKWRDDEASRFGIEPYLVLSNKTLQFLAERKPSSKDDFLLIPGIKEAKWRRYGAALFSMIGDSIESIERVDVRDPLADYSRDLTEVTISGTENSEEILPEPFRVGVFLDILNESFIGMRVSIRGEVSGVENRRNVIYFSLRDAEDESMMSCIMFRSEFEMCGVLIEEGSEVIVEGCPNIWKPRGRLSFRVSIIRMAGVGALKKAYDELRLKLEREGIFSPTRKKSLPKFPKRIALVTSQEGAAIGDFMANLGRHGFLVSLFDAHVEGKRAIMDLLEGIRFFNRDPEIWDVLILIRGGGSLESLEAYNSESLVRAISESKIPVLAGIGHEKDVSLMALAADMMVSTPTTTAQVISESWEDASVCVSEFSRSIFETFRERIRGADCSLYKYESAIRNVYEKRIIFLFKTAEEYGNRILRKFFNWYDEARRSEDYFQNVIFRTYASNRVSFQEKIKFFSLRIESQSPRKLLEKGYSVLLKNGRVIKHVSDVDVGDVLDAELSDGKISLYHLKAK